MNSNLKKYLLEGAKAGEKYVLGLRHGLFEGGVGIKLGNRTGNSLEFMEHRDYMPGDDLRQLDWNVYARTERLTVKMYREEINPKLDIIIDGSASMAVQDTEKSRAALGLAGLFATAAGNSGYATKSWITTENIKPVENSSSHVQMWRGIEFTGTISPHEAMERFQGGFQHHGVRIIISDLIWSGSPKHFISKVSSNSSAVIIIQVLAEDDINPPELGNVRMCDSETGQEEELFIDAAAVSKYKEVFSRHQQDWERACRESGTQLITLTAEDIVKGWNLKELMVREILRIM